MSNSILDVVNAYVVKAVRVSRARNERFERALARDNDDMPPTVDCNGRLHAPVDGYMYDDVAYRAGEYLHNPYYDSGVFRANRSMPSVRVRGNVSDFEAIRDALKAYAEVSHGTVWGEGDCYFYVKTTRKSLINAIESFSAPKVRKVRDTSEKGVAPVGKAMVQGKIVMYKNVRNAYGITTKCMIVLDNGATVWGTIAKAITDAAIGSMVEFTATFEQARDDATHAFFKRPSKARVIAE